MSQWNETNSLPATPGAPKCNKCGSDHYMTKFKGKVRPFLRGTRIPLPMRQEEGWLCSNCDHLNN